MSSSSSNSSQFSAVDPALGYLYQVRCALLWSLQRLRKSEDFNVGIEQLDDVHFETAGGDPVEMLQTKHGLKVKADLTDYSPDIWKSLRVWLTAYTNGVLKSATKLVLVTTGLADDDSAAASLRIEQRDIKSAREKLDTAAQSSTNKALKAAFDAYLKLTITERDELLGRVTVIDASNCISDLEDELTDQVFWAAGRDNCKDFLDRLEGWWLRRVIHHLTSSPNDRISSAEIDNQMDDLRSQFHRDSLPIDDDLLQLMVDETKLEEHRNHTFVLQLRMIGVGKSRILNAVHDYYRAYEQRSRWLRKELLFECDLHKYEKRLIEEWQRAFAAADDELTVSATEEEKNRAARLVLRWAETEIIPIRPGVSEPFVSRGSFQILADRPTESPRIGWRTDFLEKLSELLGVAGGAA